MVDGYEMKTTFWQDFSIADVFGAKAVKDTFKRAFAEWKSNVVYITELALVINWKCWKHREAGNEELGKLYHDLYYQVHGWCCDNLEGEDMAYYFRVTD